MSFKKDDPDIKKGLLWFIEHQEKDGQWRITYVKGKKITDNAKNRDRRLWIALAVCRMLKRFYK